MNPQFLSLTAGLGRWVTAMSGAEGVYSSTIMLASPSAYTASATLNISNGGDTSGLWSACLSVASEEAPPYRRLDVILTILG